MIGKFTRRWVGGVRAILMATLATVLLAAPALAQAPAPGTAADLSVRWEE